MFNIKKIINTILGKSVIVVAPLEIASPYMPEYRTKGDISDRDHLQKMNTPMTQEEYHGLFKSLINKESFIDNKSNLAILNLIHADMKQIYDKIKIIENLGIKISMDVTGGAVRDFVLGKPIKDLDIMLSFNDSGKSKQENEYGQGSPLDNINKEILKKAGFSATQLKSVFWSDEESDLNVKKTKLVQLCFLGEIDTVYCYENQERLEERFAIDSKGEEYIDISRDRMCGVIKLNMPTHYKTDILVTDLSKTAFLNEFDINLCKASFSFINNNYDIKFPANPETLLSRFSADITFFADIFHKKLTIDVNQKGPKMLDSTMDKHLPRVQAKYPDYQPNVLSYNNLKPDLLVYLRKKKLEENLDEKPVALSKSKI